MGVTITDELLYWLTSVKCFTWADPDWQLDQETWSPEAIWKKHFGVDVYEYSLERGVPNFNQISKGSMIKKKKFSGRQDHLFINTENYRCPTLFGRKKEMMGMQLCQNYNMID